MRPKETYSPFIAYSVFCNCVLLALPRPALKSAVLLSLFLSMLIACDIPSFAQNVGDHYTAGFTHSRLGVNVDMGDFKIPLRRVGTIQLADVENANVLLVFEDSLLIGEGGEAITYHLFDRSSGEKRWEQSLGSASGRLNYIPAFAQDVVFLGGSTTAGVKAVRVSTGEELWRDDTAGNTSGRYPVLTQVLVVYHDENKLAAARAETGETVWEFNVETAPAPISLFAGLVFLVDSNQVVHAINLFNGEEVWQSAEPSGTPLTDQGFLNNVATEKYVFVSGVERDTQDIAQSFVRAIDTRNGELLWGRSGNIFFVPGLLLAYDRLYEVGGSLSKGEIGTFNPDSGALLWNVEEPGLDVSFEFPLGTVLSHPQIANNSIYYFNSASKRILARDAFAGTILWSIATGEDEVQDLSLAGGQLFVLFQDRIEVYEPSHEIFFAHFGDGGGQATLITLSNVTSEQVTGAVKFFDDDGEPLLLGVEGREEQLAKVPFTIPARASVKIQTAGGPSLRPGWARVESDQPIRGSSIFQFAEGDRLAEAGVADAKPSGQASVFVLRAGNISTGIAISVPVNENASLMLGLLDDNGSQVASTPMMIPSGGHAAGFIEELFPLEVGSEFEGTLVVDSNVPVVVTALRAQNGLQLSSSPVAQTAR